MRNIIIKFNAIGAFLPRGKVYRSSLSAHCACVPKTLFLPTFGVLFETK